MAMTSILSQATSHDTLRVLQDMQRQVAFDRSGTSVGESSKGPSFLQILKDGVSQVDQMQLESDKQATALAVGDSGNLHEAMLAATHAELSFNLMVQIRNKGLEAYQQVMTMPV